MQNAETLKQGRDLLLKLHKTLVDHERAIYEGTNGPQTAGQFLNLLIEDPEFSWLRKFSTLIVDIDEMFAQKDGFTEETVELHIAKLRELVRMENEDAAFLEKYRSALQADLDAAAHQGALKDIFG
jgi:hypothetical protein